MPDGKGIHYDKIMLFFTALSERRKRKKLNYLAFHEFLKISNSLLRLQKNTTKTTKITPIKITVKEGSIATTKKV